MQTIGNYKIARLLGKGGMSEVYEVENVRLGSRHALKLFTFEGDDAEVKARFEAEGKLLARLNHPRIVKVTDCGTDEASGRPYFVMDLVVDPQGRPRSLADVEPGTADEDEIGRWYDDIREGLAYIHGEGVIHRDLKLQNVLIGADGHAVLTDFGISKVGEAPNTGKKVVDTVNTIVKMREGRSLVMGSIGYMAPELEMGVAASVQSDWYALGVIVYRLLTGTWCDARTDVVAMLETFDPAWRRIVPQLLHANPQGRACLSFADERRADRERAEAEAEERLLKVESAFRRWRRCGFLFGCAMGLALVVLVALFVRQKAENAALVERASIPAFEDVFKVPVEATQGAGRDAAFRLQRAKGSLADAWVLTHTTFEDLKKGRISYEKALAVIENLAKKSEPELLGQFSSSMGLMVRGDLKTLATMLREAALEMRRRAPAGGGDAK